MARLGVAVVGLGLVALVVAYLFFGWPVLLVGVPAFVAVALVVVAVLVSETPRRSSRPTGPPASTRRPSSRAA